MLLTVSILLPAWSVKLVGPAALSSLYMPPHLEGLNSNAFVQDQFRTAAKGDGIKKSFVKNKNVTMEVNSE